MLGKPVAVAVARGEMGQQSLDRRPGSADEGVTLGAGGDRVAPDLEHELRAEVLPVVDVLVVVAVGAVERVVVGPADVVRHRPADLADARLPGGYDPDHDAGSSTAIAASRSRMPRASSSGKRRRIANEA